ncbi:MAG: hypothetical protein L0241_31815 [Planctomycetia bacterium]|nr:hypothetical protein [Planctomycetia bacterium]
MRTAFVLVFTFALCGVAVDPKLDFTVTAESLAKEYKADGKAAKAKYAGKVVEVTGTVETTNLDGITRPPIVWLNGYREKPTDITQAKILVNIATKDLEPKVRPLAKGQQVVIRGTMDNQTVPALDKCEFVKIGPSTAMPVTVAGLEAEFKKNRDAAWKKYNDKSVVVKAKVVKIKKDDKTFIWTVTDPTGKGTVQLKAYCEVRTNEKLQEELSAIKVNDVIILLADADHLGEPVRFWNAMVLKEPPPGVKLPGDKK